MTDRATISDPASPLGALARGLIAGAISSAVQSLFFAATKRIAPTPPPMAFDPPEPQQWSEQATETVARRASEMMERELPVKKATAGKLVHYAFGSAWGGAYGLSAATFPALRGPAGGAGFGVLVWLASDDLLLPAFKLSAWPNRYPLRSHAYAIAAHLAYGAALGFVYSLLGPKRRERDTLVTASEPRALEVPVPPSVHRPDMFEPYGSGI